ncbi:MAG: hypothetical protein CMO20_01595 [Thermoplasmata archaeon]|nr:hypothetical protein [Thermoplasmata archaeon]
MAGLGNEASTPWGDSEESPEISKPPEPIVLSGAEGLSLNTQIQGQMPNQLTPTSKGNTLSGSVGTIDSSVWASQQQIAGQGSMIKGIGITCLFGIAMTLIPMLIFGYAEDSYDDDWHEENMDIDWDEAGLNGTFQLDEGDLQECYFEIDTNMYFSSGSSDRIEKSHHRIDDDCGGDLVIFRESIIVEFSMLNDSWGEFTYFPDYYHGLNDSITLTLPEVFNGSLGSQSFDANMTPLKYQVNITNWVHCSQTIIVEDDNQPFDVDIGTNFFPQEYWYSMPPNCANMSYFSYQRIVVGAIDYETGFGEFFFNEKIDENTVFRAQYYTNYDDDFDIFEIVSCLAPLISLVFFIFWIVQVVRAFQGGLTKQGTGMLIGIIPAFFGSIFLTFIISIMLFGF